MRKQISSVTLVLLVSIALVSVRPSNSIAQRASSSGRSSSVQSIDGGWPRGFSLPSEAQIVIFQP
jgi:hypothetical protein